MNKRIFAITTLAVALAAAACGSDTADDPIAAPTTNEAASPSSTSTAPADDATSSSPADETPITITAGDQTFTAVLNDSQVSQDFIEMLPVTLPWFRQGGIEYISELDAPLTETGPFYTDVEAGDIVYYNPADSITIIYAPTSSVPTLTKMGEITSDLDAFKDLPQNIDRRIEVNS